MTIQEVIDAELASWIQHFVPVPASEVAEVYCRIALLNVIVCVDELFAIFTRGATVDTVEFCITEQPNRFTRPVPVVVIIDNGDMITGLLVI